MPENAITDPVGYCHLPAKNDAKKDALVSKQNSTNTRWITFKLTGKDNMPVKNVLIKIQEPNSKDIFQGTSDDSGIVKIENIPDKYAECIILNDLEGITIADTYYIV